MDCFDQTMKEIRDAVESISSLRNSAYSHYRDLVDLVLKDKITDERWIEEIMDGLLDFCDEQRFFELYRSLCRHIYYRYPQLVGEHVSLFRAQFESASDSEDD